jgi:hypothetical protein
MTRCCCSRPRVLMIAVLLLAATQVGCGYTWGAPYRQGIQTVHVEMFGSREFRRDIEFQLTEAVKKRIATDTPYRLSKKADADSLMSGEILEVRRAAFAPDPLSRLPRQQQLTLAIRLRWQDLRTGEFLIDQPLELQAMDYIPPLGETEDYGLQKVTDRMAEKITGRMYDQQW